MWVESAFLLQRDNDKLIRDIRFRKVIRGLTFRRNGHGRDNDVVLLFIKARKNAVSRSVDKLDVYAQHLAERFCKVDIEALIFKPCVIGVLHRRVADFHADG